MTTTSPQEPTLPEPMTRPPTDEQPLLVICEHCDWRFSLPRPAAIEGSTLPRCPHCYHLQLKSLPADGAQEPEMTPELVVPFEVSENTLHQRLQAFAAGIRFAPPDLTLPHLTARLQRVFLPMWLVDADTSASWDAELGYEYEVVSHQAHYGDHQGWDSREVNETRIRWEPRLGTLKRSYQNISAPALEDHARLLKVLGDYDLRKAAPHQPGSLAEAATRLPNRGQEDAWPSAVLSVQAAAAEECRQAAQADHIRGFRWSPEYQAQNWTHLLLPMYTTFYLDDEQAPQPILIHGQRGRLHGRRRASMARARRTAGILLGIAAVVLLAGLGAGAFSVLLPALLLPAGIGVFLGVLIGFGAGLPLLIVWQFNRTQGAKDRR